MKKKESLITLCFLIILVVNTISYSQSAPNHSCATAISLCESKAEMYDFKEDVNSCSKPFYYYFYSDAPISNAFYVDYLYPYGGQYTLYRIGAENELSFDACNDFESGLATVVDNFVFTTPFNITIPQAGLYLVKIRFENCFKWSPGLYPELVLHAIDFNMSSEAEGHLSCQFDQPELECKDCITSFSPTVGDYMVSAWVKESGATTQTITYSKASIRLSFSGNSSEYTLTPSGKIIDGWQKIEGLITVPNSATGLHLSFETTAGDAYFDDIRFYPVDGSMVSYVYDPVNLRLMAQLDERNYATFYEYDEEGKLIRVKKETERGTMTIQENRDNIKKR